MCVGGLGYHNNCLPSLRLKSSVKKHPTKVASSKLNYMKCVRFTLNLVHMKEYNFVWLAWFNRSFRIPHKCWSQQNISLILRCHTFDAITQHAHPSFWLSSMSNVVIILLIRVLSRFFTVAFLELIYLFFAKTLHRRM